jgi:hypothetical protein
MSAELEIQKAVFNRLNTSLNVPVYDNVPDNAQAPYVVIGDDTLTEYDTFGELGFEATVTIHSWSVYRGRKQVKEIMGSIYDALHRAELTVTGYNLIGCDCEFSETFLESDGVTRHGVQRFRILIREINHG